MIPEYRMDLAGMIIAVQCRQPGLAAGLAAWFDRPSAAGDPHLTLDLELIAHDDQPDLPNSLLTTKKLGPNGSFDIADGLITGKFDPTTHRGELKVKTILMTGRLPRIVEQIFYQAFHSVKVITGREAWLVHSAAVIVQGRGFLFVGPSEAGKSTVARLSRDHHVLGDEMNLVIPSGDGLDVVGTLFNGTFRDKRPGRAPLAGLFMLEQAPAHRLVDVSEAEAAAFLAGELVPPVGLDEVPGTDTLSAMVDAAAGIVGKTMLKRLEFLPDPGFWNEITAACDLPG